MKTFQKSIAIGVIAAFVLGGLFPSEVAGITVKEEEDLSRQMLTAIYSHFEIIDDPDIVSYVNEIGNRILAVLPPQPFTYHFHVIKEEVYNAFATPAGHIFVYSGLIVAMTEEDELAGILGHEIGHVYCRHISQKIEQQKKLGWATLAGVAAGVLLGVGGAGAAAQAVTMGAPAAAQAASLAYSREDEMQADEIGVKLVSEAGYSPEGLLKILKKIRAKTWFGTEQIPTYLMTHPAVQDRISYISAWIESHNASAKPRPQVNEDEFNRVHTRIETGYGDEQVVLARLEGDVARDPGDPLAHYRYGLILARVGKRQEAVEQMRMALTKRAFDPYILRDLGWIYYLDGQFPQALKMLSSASGLMPKDPDCIYYLGRTQLEMGNLTEAADNFLMLTRQYPQFPEAYYYLGQSVGKQENLGDAHYYLGVYYLKKRDNKNAEIQFKQALKLVQDEEKRKEIEKWIAQIRGEGGKKKSN